MTLRKVLFWLHLVAGVVAGVVILIMSVTGVAIAFEKQIIALAEGENRRGTPAAADAVPLTLDELLARARTAQPEARLSGITLFADKTLAPVVSHGRTNAFYMDSHTGELRAQGATGVRGFMRVMTNWHRWLGLEGEGRAVGKAITGACNAAFLVLVVSGIYLWWPRRWTGGALKGIALFRRGLSGRARDWSWHNVVGIWCACVLVVLTATGMVISYRWASDLVYRIAGSTPHSGMWPGAAPAVSVPAPPTGAQPLPYEQVLAIAKAAMPRWEQITLRPAEPGQGINVSVKEHDAWPRFAIVQLTLDPQTGKILKRESFTDQDRGRRARSWMRFLHTGEALGMAGQAIAALASLGGAVLVWTGMALSWRRFFSRRLVVNTSASDR